MKELNSEFEQHLVKLASSNLKTIVLPEAGSCERVARAGIYCAENNLAHIIFLIENDEQLKLYSKDQLKNIQIENVNMSTLQSKLASALYEKRKSKGVTPETALELIKNPVYFGTVMVELGLADGLACGALNTTANTLRPALQIIKGKTPTSLISTFMIMISENKEFGDNGILILSDCGLNENPTEQEIASIVFDTVNSTRQLTSVEPVVALLSYSTKKSADGPVPEKMRNANSIVNAASPNFLCDGELQLDAAIVPSVGQSKAPQSKVAGHANVLIFPDLSSGNISYKLLQRYAGFKCIGPICQGFKKPINDISRGADVMEIVRTILITCLQCENKGEK